MGMHKKCKKYVKYDAWYAMHMIYFIINISWDLKIYRHIANIKGNNTIWSTEIFYYNNLKMDYKFQ